MTSTSASTKQAPWSPSSSPPEGHPRDHAVPLAPGATASRPILALATACRSGTTYIFSNYLSYTAGTTLGYAAVANRDGKYVTPTPAAADAAAKPAITPADFSIVNEPGPAAYPIAGYSWVLVAARQPDQATGQALVAMLSWLTHDGQSYAASLGYVPLPAAIQRLATATLARVTGPAGTLLAS